MCLWFACSGLHKHDDDYYAPTKPPHDRTTQAPHRNAYSQPGAHYGNGGVYRASPHQTTTADEAGRKASNDARRGPAAHATTVAKDAVLAYTAAAAGTLKPQPAWNGNGAAPAQQQHYYYYEREPIHREAAATGHHYSTADHERY